MFSHYRFRVRLQIKDERTSFISFAVSLEATSARMDMASIAVTVDLAYGTSHSFLKLLATEEGCGAPRLCIV